MQTIIRSVEIPDKTPEESFDQFIAGLERNVAPQFFEGVMGPREFRISDNGTVVVGAHVTERVSAPDGGMENTLHLEVAELVPGEKYRAVLSQPNQMLEQFDEAFKFEKKNSDTILTVHFKYEARGLLGKILERLLLRRQMKRMWDTALPRIADYIANQTNTAVADR